MPTLLRLALGAFLLVAPVARAAPVDVATSGYLLDSLDAPLDGTLTFSFSIWDDATSPQALHRVWPASPNTCAVTVKAGYYSQILGDDGVCAPGLTTGHLPPGAARWLEVSVGGVTLSPRTSLWTLPSAAQAAVALSMPDGSVTNAMLQNPGLTVTAGAGLTGGGAVALGGATSLALPTVGPGAQSFTNANLTLDAFGRVTAASNGAAGGVTLIQTTGGLTGGPISTTGTLSIANSGVTAGTYTNPTVTVDATGRITSATNGSGGGASTGLLHWVSGTLDVGTATTTDATATVELRNVGGAAATPLVLTATSGFTVSSNCGSSLAPAASCTVTFALTASGTQGPRSGAGSAGYTGGTAEVIFLSGTYAPSPDGLTSPNAATSCAAIKAAHVGAGSRSYWIDPDGTGPLLAFQAWCDMTTTGGPWMLVFSSNTVNGSSLENGTIGPHANLQTLSPGAAMSGLYSGLGNVTGLRFACDANRDLINDVDWFYSSPSQANALYQALKASSSDATFAGSANGTALLLGKAYQDVVGGNTGTTGPSATSMTTEENDPDVGDFYIGTDSASFPASQGYACYNGQGLPVRITNCWGAHDAHNDMCQRLGPASSYAASVGGGYWYVFVASSVGVAGDGSSAAYAATSCAALKTAFPSKLDGAYWIDTDGSGGPVAPFFTYCDMSTSNGGPWTLVYSSNAVDGTNEENGAIAPSPLLQTLTPGGQMAGVYTGFPSVSKLRFACDAGRDLIKDVDFYYSSASEANAVYQLFKGATGEASFTGSASAGTLRGKAFFDNISGTAGTTNGTVTWEEADGDTGDFFVGTASNVGTNEVCYNAASRSPIVTNCWGAHDNRANACQRVQPSGTGAYATTQTGYWYVFVK